MLAVLLICLATYRITRLLVADTFPPIAVQRARVAERWGDHSWQAYLSTCSWCASMYVAAAVVWITDVLVDHIDHAAGSVPYPGWTWLAASAATGIIASVEDYMDTRAKAHERN